MRKSLLLAAAVTMLPAMGGGASAQTVAQPWSVAGRMAVDALPFQFSNAGAVLRGTLYMPRVAGRVPVVVAFHGAAAPSRDHPLYAHLKAMLPPLGVAVLVWDRRGTGASGGDDARKTDFDLLASDGVAAFRALAADRRVDPSRIGFWGLSQGGWLSLLAAAREPKAAFAVSVSCPMVGADVQMNFAVSNVMRIKGYPQSDIDAAVAARTAVDAYALGRSDRATAAAAEGAAKRQPWWRDSYLAGNIDDPTWPGMIRTDPVGALDRSRVPTLMVYGQADPWVPVAVSLAALDRTAARHPNVAVRIVAGADHAMAVGVPPSAQVDPAGFGTQAPDSPEYYGLLASWLSQVLRLRPA